MEQNIFDVAEDVSFPWLPAYGEATEQNQLSTSSRILETIVEETSDDDDNGQTQERWSQFEHVWSSGGSDTGSVIRVDTPSDQDTMSERDFICPPKRRKQENEDFMCNESTVFNNRKPKIEIDGLEPTDYFMKRHNEQRLRFDEIGHDLFTDSDSLSYASLSRSSSLIQFESLERQIQSDGSIQQVLSGSSPSIYSIDSVENSKLNDSSFYNKKSNLLTASNLIHKNNVKHQQTPQQNLNISDSELYSSSSVSSGSSANSSYNYVSDDCDLNHENRSEINNSTSNDTSSSKCSIVKCVENRKKLHKNKNSIESLSEDSGYCDHLHFNMSNLKTKSKSLTNFNSTENINIFVDSPSIVDYFDNYKQEQKHAFNNYGRRLTTVDDENESEIDDDDDDETESIVECSDILPNKYENNNKTELWLNTKNKLKHNNCTKIELEASKHSPTLASPSSTSSCAFITTKITPPSPTSSDSESRSRSSSQSPPPLPIQYDRKTKNNFYCNRNDEDQTSSVQFHHKIISTSSPDLFSINCENNHIKINQKCLSNINNYNSENFAVSSVPECLNLCGSNNNFNYNAETIYMWNNAHDTNSVASKNFNLYNLQPKKSVKFQQPVNNNNNNNSNNNNKKHQNIRASYANLTILDYSDEDDDCNDNQYYLNVNSNTNLTSTNNNNNNKMSQNQQNNDFDDDDDDVIIQNDYGDKNVFNSLLDEISAHFDRNLSIINDQVEAYEPIATFLSEQKGSKPQPPQPPPRRTQIKTNPHQSPTDKPEIVKRTFDQDPTNLVTCYAQSLERCNFDLTESSQQLYHQNRKASDLNLNVPIHHSTPIKRDFISSTPNLNYYHAFEQENDYNSRHNSMKNVSCLSTAADVGACRNSGILATTPGGSKCGLSKGVSFCPIVSEIIWKDNHSDIEVDDADSIPSNHSIEFDEYDHDRENANLHLTINKYESFEDFNHYQPPTQNDHQQTLLNEHMSNDHEYHTYVDLLTRQPDIVNVKKRDSDNNVKVNNNNKKQKHMDSQNSNTVTLTSIKMIGEEDSSACYNTINNNNNNNITNSNNNNKSNNNKISDNLNKSVVIKDPVKMNVNNNFILAESSSSAVNVPAAATPIKPTAIITTNSNGNELNNKNINNNNNLIKNIKNNKNEKKGKNFLSRISSGFRFSFRNKSKKNKESVVSDNKSNVKTKDDNNKKSNKDNNDKVTNEFIYIPLKENQLKEEELLKMQMNTVSLVNEDEDEDEVDNLAAPDESDFNHLSDSNMMLNSTMNSSNVSSNKNHVLISKPPLPKLPPRVVGVCAKRSTTPKSAHAHRASSTPPREIDVDNNLFYNNITSTTNDNTFEGAGLAPRHFNTNSDNNNYFNHIMGSEQKIGLIETNLDTHETIISGKTRSLMELGGPQLQNHNQQIKRLGCVNGIKTQTTTNTAEPGRPHKSMEFLLDKENQRNVLPPENELQKSHESGANLSEHQLRVQASLQRLNVPDWYKQYSNKECTQNTGVLRKRNSDVGRWAGLNSKTTSLSSLGSHRSDRSPVMLSPSAHSHHGQTGFSRWSTSHLNSNQTSPSVSTRGSFSRGGLNASVLSGYSTSTAGTNPGVTTNNSSIRNSFRQPYLGWRSQEKLSQPRTPAERLASSLLSQTKIQKPDPVVTQEIQSSIKEVTSAIVHYVNDQTNRNSRSRSASPSQRCWLESSFVGTRPLESPQTPNIDNSSVLGHQQPHNHEQQPNDHYRYSTHRVNGVGESTLI